MSDEFRTPEYLSPSALALWENDPDEGFIKYIVPKDLRPPKEPQTGPMSVGSAFDALVKSFISRVFFGDEKTEETGYRIRDLVVAQCEEHTLPLSLELACDLFEQYRECGAYSNLLHEIRQSPVDPRMEFDVIDTIGGVPLLGKPDLHYHTIMHTHVITDWKVSGSVSVHGVSPQQGFQNSLGNNVKNPLTDPDTGVVTGKAHKKYEPFQHPGGVWVNRLTMDKTTDYWADQLSTYAWCLGEEVGTNNFVVRIEQLACRPGLKAKCVVHQSTVNPDYQKELLERYQRVWASIQSKHYWPDLPIEQSRARGDMIMMGLRRKGEPTIETNSIVDVPEIQW